MNLIRLINYTYLHGWIFHGVQMIRSRPKSVVDNYQRCLYPAMFGFKQFCKRLFSFE